MRLAASDRDVAEPVLMHRLDESGEVFRRDVLGDHAAFGSDQSRQPHGVVAAAGADIADRHAGRDAEKPRHLTEFIGGVAFGRGVPDRADRNNFV